MFDEATSERQIGRYELCSKIGSGGAATVYLGREVEHGRLKRVVAVKRLHPHVADDPRLVSMLFDEARLVALVRHRNVVPILDVVEAEREAVLVLEYVHGESLAALRRHLDATGGRILPRIAVGMMVGCLHGLHAAHEAVDENGARLNIVHRDVSPQNILIGTDGVARVLDFGVAKAAGRLQTTTKDGQLKGKFAYMAPEQLRGAPLDRRVDVYAASVTLWECLTGQRLFARESEPEVLVTRILFEEIPRPSTLAPDLEPRLEDVVMRGLSRRPEDRFATALEMADALESVVGGASSAEVAQWLKTVAADLLQKREESLARAEVGLREASASGEDTARTIATMTAPSRGAMVTSQRRRRSLWGLGALGLATAIGLSVAFSLKNTSRSAALLPPPASVAASTHAEEPVASAPAQAVVDRAPAPSTMAPAPPDRGSARPRPPSKKPARPPPEVRPPAARPPAVSTVPGLADLPTDRERDPRNR